MDGATLDLSTRSTVLNAQSATTDGLRIFAFEENATIGVKIGDRKVSSRLPVVSWTSETKPQNVDTVKFTRGDDRKYWLEVKDDGLYCISPGLIILIK